MADLYPDIHKGSNTDRYNGYNTINADMKVSLKKWASRVAGGAKSVGNRLSEPVKGGIKSVRKLLHKHQDERRQTQMSAATDVVNGDGLSGTNGKVIHMTIHKGFTMSISNHPSSLAGNASRTGKTRRFLEV